ncbi:hypothetical protein FISHEDRAFT_74345 [Fistulina hepatica ATCC 64428]|uniref:CoA-dependent acyltransferase n=1 Tax=Fistulina hepatica ATCC 64428 TaxID=1128425 RepID=A0A0D7AAH5_9AGAR|nr:hypothetical protein FISHEDRAFT_74345 [Fistulina hepatica ATCC 64428]
MSENSVPRYPALQSTKYEDYFFHEAEPGVFARKTLGYETTFILFSKDDLRIASNIVACALVYVVSDADIESLLREVWIQLRYKVPHIACTTHALDAGEFEFRYTVPASSSDIEKWLAATLTFDERPQRHLDGMNTLSSTLASYVSTGRYNSELFACPCAEGGYLLSLKSGHHAVDGVGAILLWTQFFDILASLAKGEAFPPPKWGQEVQRLPPALMAVVAGSEEALVETARKAALLPPFEEPRDDMQWIPKHRVGPGGVSALVTVSREGTAALHRVSKEERVTVTDVLTGLAVLAQTNAALEDARRRGGSYFNEIASRYLKAQNYIIPISAAARIAMLPEKYQSFDNGMPLLTMETSFVSIPMASIKKAVLPDSVRARVVRNNARSAVSDVIQDVHQVLKSIDYSRDATLTRHARSFDPIPYTLDLVRHTPSLMMLSSIGDVQSFFKKHMRPLSSENEKGIRMKHSLGYGNNQTAGVLATASQLDGSLLVNCACGGGDEGAETMRNFVALFIQYLDQFIGQDGAAVLSALSVINTQGDDHTKSLKSKL